MGACCSPGREAAASGSAPPDARAGSPILEGMIELPGGTFSMGTADLWTYPDDGEGPVHEVTLAPFRIDAATVTNARFGAFIEETGYRTDAERYEWAFVFAGLLPDDFEDTRGVAQAPWWRQVYGADWAHPEGPQSNVDDRGDHPVVQVSWRDASAFCSWAGVRLPTEAEWEYAARGGLVGAVFPWGNDLEPDGRHRMNVWQGTFPTENSLGDGYYGTAPVDTFEPNGFGLYNMTGNVWEWCADWYDPSYYARSTPDNPTGSEHGEARVMRGGSYLCHASYCNRYRVGARSGNGPDSNVGNLGFRCAADV